MDNLLRLRLSRYRQTPNVLKRVNAHAVWREQSTSVLVHCLENFAEFRKTRIKSGRSVLCPYYILSQPIGKCGIKGLYLVFI